MDRQNTYVKRTQKDYSLQFKLQVVKEGENLCYMNSLLNLSLGINMGNFSENYKVFSGLDWKIEVTKAN